MARVTTLTYNLLDIPQEHHKKYAMVLFVEHFAVRPVYVDRAPRTTELTTESPRAGGKHA